MIFVWLGEKGGAPYKRATDKGKAIPGAVH
jgi:hypothetical protein